jgi:hypothetical protein
MFLLCISNNNFLLYASIRTNKYCKFILNYSDMFTPHHTHTTHTHTTPHTPHHTHHTHTPHTPHTHTTHTPHTHHTHKHIHTNPGHTSWLCPVDLPPSSSLLLLSPCFLDPSPSVLPADTPAIHLFPPMTCLSYRRTQTMSQKQFTSCRKHKM